MATRRELLFALAASGAAGACAVAEESPKHTADFRVVTTGLAAPEGPKALADGSVLVCEMARGTVTRVWPDGKISVVAQLGGSPNGIALGADGAAYVVNSGGMHFTRQGNLLIPDRPAPERFGGQVQRIDLASGSVTTLYSGGQLRAPNDVVFDRWGGLWFSDPGVAHAQDAQQGAVFWAKPDGSEIRLVWHLPAPNGIAFSPDHRTLYVALTGEQAVVACDVEGPGQLVHQTDGSPRARCIARLSSPRSYFDSMAVEADGTLVVGTLFLGCLSLFTPQGRLRDQLFFPERFVTNLAFGGRDMRDAYVTLTSTGRLVLVRWPRPGLRLVNQ